ncbi:hypothetical protein RB598_005096 [Gaeumannomyces tritici]
MSPETDMLLLKVLAELRKDQSEAMTEALLGWVGTLFVDLQNPLNISILAREVLLSRAVWSHPAAAARPLATCMRVMAMFKSACARVLAKSAQPFPPSWGQEPERISLEAWSNAVAAAFDGQSEHWKGLLAHVGLLVAIQQADVADVAAPAAAPGSQAARIRKAAANSRRRAKADLERRVEVSTNMGLRQLHGITDFGKRQLPEAAMTLAVSHACPLLTETQSRYKLNLELLVPAALHALAHNKEGLQGFAFMVGINDDVRFHQDGSVDWPKTSKSFEDVERATTTPLIAALGPLSQVLAHAVTYARSPELVGDVLNGLIGISDSLSRTWGATRLSGLEHKQDGLSAATRNQTLPVLLNLQRNVMYACMQVLQAVVYRAAWDSDIAIGRSMAAPRMLRVLRNLSFVTLRPGNGSFAAYQTSYSGAVDLLARNPQATFRALHGMLMPSMAKRLSEASGLEKTLAQFYMGLAENLPDQLSHESCQLLVLKQAGAIISAPASPTPDIVDLALYETAHAATLAVFACQRHSDLRESWARPYALNLLEAFPARISARQFRLGFKHVVKYLFPPYTMTPGGDDSLASAALEVVNGWAAEAAKTGTAPLAPHADDKAAGAPLTEQSVLVLTLVDSLPVVPVAELEEWLAVVAKRFGEIVDPAVRDVVRRRLLAVLVDGELDVEQAAVAVAWWGTHGGHSLVDGAPRNQL